MIYLNLISHLRKEIKMNKYNIFTVLRFIRNIPRKKLAEMAEISESTISCIEKGKRNLSKRALRDYAKVLGVSSNFIEEYKNPLPNERYEEYLFRVLEAVLKYDEMHKDSV